MPRTLVALVFVASLAVAADPPVKAPPPAEKAFFAGIKTAQAKLTKLKSYTVTAEGKWTTTGGKKELSGTNTVLMHAEAGGKLRLEVGAKGDPEPHLIVASDGKTMTRLFAAADLYSVVPADSTPLDDLQSDGVTIPALQAAGVDFLARPDMAASLAAQTVKVDALPDEKGKGAGFKLTLANGKTAEVRFGTGPDPLPERVTVVSSIAVGEKRTLTQTVTTSLTWTFDAKPAPFAVAIPKSAKKVDDLGESLFAPDAADLIGKPAPAVEFAGLDGKPVKLADLKGKPVVVYAWAIWAAPTGKGLPDVTKFADEYGKKGVHFLAVNAGDKPEAVAEFVKASKYGGLVALDPLGSGLSKLRAQAVPAVVVLDKAGNVAAMYRGKPDTMEKVKSDLDKLLK